MAGSMLLVREFFDREDQRFLGELYACDAAKSLKAFGAAWAADARPFARAALLAYIDEGCDRPHHRALVKKLFKELEAKGDDEAMGHFMVAFDRLVRRDLVTTTSFDWRTRQEITTTRLVATTDDDDNDDNDEERFSTRTRRYLKRRAWRYFRYLGGDVPRYGRAIRAALALYEDPNLATPIDLLDAWGLVHALYRGAEALDRDPKGVRVASGRSMKDLTPAPHLPEAWEGCFAEVLHLARVARARTVRTFAIGVLRSSYAKEITAIPAKDLIAFVTSIHAEHATFGVDLLGAARGVDTLTVRDWLALLGAPDEQIAAAVVALVKTRLRRDRLTLEQVVEIASARQTAVAELGLGWAREAKIETDAALAALAGLLRAKNPALKADCVRVYVEALERSPFATPERVRDLFDAPDAIVRAEGAAVLERAPRFQDDVTLWAALSETPWPDVRTFMIKHLGERQRHLLGDERRHLWASTLLSIRRGSRDKRAALRQISDRIVRRPAEAPALAPLLAIALRSARETERRAALAAIARAAFAAPPLRAALGDAIPELRLAFLEAG